MELPKQKSKPVNDLKKYIIQIYGEPKVGKSTFASKFPNALFIATEPGHKFLSVFGGDKIHQTWDDIRDTVRRLCAENHQFETVIIDTTDNAIKMCKRYIKKREGIKHESDLQWGKGWSFVKEEFESVVGALANRGFGLVFISHIKETTRTHRGVDRSFIDNSLDNAGKLFINGLSDFIFYAFMDDDQNRLLRTKANLNVNAGDRSGILPEIIPMDYDVLKNELQKEWKSE